MLTHVQWALVKHLNTRSSSSMEDAVGTLCAWSFLRAHVGSLGWWSRPCWGCDLWSQDYVTRGCQGAKGTVSFYEVPQCIRKHQSTVSYSSQKRLSKYGNGRYEQCSKSRKTESFPCSCPQASKCVALFFQNVSWWKFVQVAFSSLWLICFMSFERPPNGQLFSSVAARNAGEHL